MRLAMWRTGWRLAALAGASALVLAMETAVVAGQGAGAAGGSGAEVVIRLGERTLTRSELEAALGFESPGVLRRIREDPNAVRFFALEWFRRMLFERAAREDGLLDRLPGLEEAAAERARRLVAERYVDEIQKGYAPTDEELDLFYKMHGERCDRPARYRLARIGVVVALHASPEEEAAARSRIERVAERLAAGEGFAALFKEASDMKATEPGGGLGWVTDAELEGEPGAEVFRSLAPGETSRIVRTPRGFEIFKLLEKEEAHRLSREECEPLLRAALEKSYRSSIAARKADELVERFGASMNIDAFVAAARAARSRSEAP